MKVLFVGLGSIAGRHIKNIKIIDQDIQIALWRQLSKETDLGEVASLVSEVFFSEADAVGWKPDVVFVTNPAPRHCQTALTFARNNCHLFIEKPLAVSEDGLDELAKEVAKRKLVAMVGYVLRFSEPMKIMKETIGKGLIGKPLSIRASVGQNLLDWRPGKDYQETVSSRSDLGGGVCFELSHEIDYVRWLFGEVKELRALFGKVGDLNIDVEDLADILLKFDSGAYGNIHLDMVDQAKERSCRIVGSKGTLTWDSCDENRVRVFKADEGIWQDLYCSPSEDRNEMYIAQIKHFFDCIANNKQALVSLAQARKVLQIVINIKNLEKDKKAIPV
ncbi:MAG: Gfo/Idh/MocA family oxidoreductase [Candidatus Omnitrophica bacterium]|nr:Gfo/Idh/MocA family oxidoreductase [Candidatus Omnitrophota bacterium]